MSSDWTNAFKQSLKRPTFAIVLVVLLVGAIGIEGASRTLQLHFRKEAMPLRAKEGLAALPMQLGSWICVPEPHTVNADLEHELGTDKYVFRTYVDLSAMSGGAPVTTRDAVLGLDKLTPQERDSQLNQIRNRNNNAVISFAVTYYTGKVDTVPHVPDRCYVADGFQPTLYDIRKWTLGNYAPGVPRQVKSRFIDFEDQTARGGQNRCVAYFFHVNGEYQEDPKQVRLRLQNLFERYGYFAKIEVMTLLPMRPGTAEKDPQKEKDREKASDAMQKFLTAALPEVEKLLPDTSVFKKKN
jgi:hypothetical protein